MKGRNRGRRGELEARNAWTTRLNRFAGVRKAKQRAATLDTALKINPGGTLRDMLQAWGYSASARGRKSKEARGNGTGKTARVRLEQTLSELFGNKPTPVPSLYAKLAGRVDTTVKDACRIAAALMLTWPEPIEAITSKCARNQAETAFSLAESFVRELLSDLSGGRSHEWSDDDLEVHVFRLKDEERVGVSQFIGEAGEKEGALIVAGARNILIGPHPVDTIRQFHTLTSDFISGGDGGILVFVFDAAIFEAGKRGFGILDNVGLLTTAMTAFALFPEDYDYRQPIHQHKVDWSRWRKFSRRCCAVIRKPPLVDPSSGDLLSRDKFDEFVASWQHNQNFARLQNLQGFVRFDSSHILPRTYPAELGDLDVLSGRDLYWDVTIRHSSKEANGLEVQYFIPPPRDAAGVRKDQDSTHRGRGRPPAKTLTIEEDFIYVIRKDSPGEYYDDAQRAIYLAARGRLNLDSGDRHVRNLNAAAALRQLGYEVLPITILLSLFPRALYFSATESQEP